MNLRLIKKNMFENDRVINSTCNGHAWDFETMLLVWEKGREIPGCDPNELRWDICGRVMCKRYFNVPNADTGWAIDHILPVAKGGGDELTNLQPLNWKTNLIKGDNISWRCNSLDL